MPPQENYNNKVIYAYASRQPVNNENQGVERPKKRWQPPVHPTKDLIVTNTSNQSQERQNSVKKDKGRRSMPANFTNWSTADSNQEQLQSTGKENKPAYAADTDGACSDSRIKNVKDRVAELPKNVPSQSQRHNVDNAKSQHHRLPGHQQVCSQSQVHTPKESHVVKSQAIVHPHQRVHPSPSLHPNSQVHSQAQAHVQTPQEKEQDSEAGLTWSVAKLRNLYSQGTSSNIFYDPIGQQSKDSRPGKKKAVNEATNANANEEYI